MLEAFYSSVQSTSHHIRWSSEVSPSMRNRQERGWEEGGKAVPHRSFTVHRLSRAESERQFRERKPMELVVLCPLRARLPEWHPFPLPPLLPISSSLLCKPNCQPLFGWTDLGRQLGKFAPLLDKWWIKPQSPGTEERLLPWYSCHQMENKGKEWVEKHLWHLSDCPLPYPSIGNCASLY